MRIVWVDGFRIRNTFDPDFTRHRTKLTAPYVPVHEAWVENFLRPEENLIRLILWVEEEFIRKHQTLRQAREFLVRKIEKETAQKPIPCFIKSSGIAYSNSSADDLKIVFVNGRIVRRYIDPYFVAGGHDLVYGYIPAKTVWIDTSNYALDRPFVLAHEVKERELMAGGMNYFSAHDFAIAEEKRLKRLAGLAKFLGE